MQMRLPTDRFMGLRQTISEWMRIIKDGLDFGPEFPAAMEARHVMFAQESARLQHLLDQTRKAAQEKDELIARLRAAGVVTGNMVVDGPAYYIKQANTLDGPFCTSCFQRNHEINRIASAPKPKGADGTPADWVQCARCQTPFRSDRIRQYLNPTIGAGPDDIQQTTEDISQKTEDTSPKTEDTSPKTEDTSPKTEERGQTTEVPALSAPTLPPPSADQGPEPTLVQTLVCPPEDDAPKPAKTARKPRRDRGSRAQRSAMASLTKRPAGQQPAELAESRLEKAPTSETELEEKGSGMEDPVLQAPRPSRTRPRTRKPKRERSE